MADRGQYGGRTVAFSMRNLRADYRDRVRLIAIRYDCGLEEAFNIVLSAGLGLLERGANGMRKEPRT